MRDKEEAERDAKKLGLTNCKFEVQDVRSLGERRDLFNKFDIILCAENIEHILNDNKLMKDMAYCLKEGGKLILTTPNSGYIPIGKGDAGPFLKIEDGGHVRKGYSKED